MIKAMSGYSILIWCLFILNICCIKPVWSSETTVSRFELAEKEWLLNHPQIRVGIMDAWPPLNFVDDQGNPQGIGADYLKVINKQLNMSITFVPGSFKENYDLVKEKKLDALMDITPKKEREPFFNFTRPYITIPHVIVSRKDGPYFSSEKDLAGKTIALERGFYNIKYFQKNYPEVIIKEYNSTSESLDAVSRGEADAYAGNRAVVIYLIEKELLTNLRLQGRMNKPDSVLSIGVRKDWPELASILNHVLASITREEESRIRGKWIALNDEKDSEENPIPASGEHNVNGAAVTLSFEEQQFIQQQKPLRFSEVPWEPLSIITDSGQFDGMIADYLKFISEKTGLLFEYEKSDTWTEVLDKYVAGIIDVIPAIGKEDEIGRSIMLSESFITFPLVIVTKDTVSYIVDTAELNGKKVAVGRGYTSSHFLKNNYPEIILEEVDSVEKALIKLSNNDVFAFVGHMAVAVDAMQKLGLKNLKIAGETEYRFDHRIGVDPDYPEAVSIINKALDLMSEEESRAIYRKWLQVEYARGIDYSLIWKIVAGAALFLAMVIFWNRRLAREISGRKQAEERFISIAASVPGVIFQVELFPDGNRQYNYLSQRAEEFFGVPPETAIHEKRLLSWHPEDHDRIEKEIQTSISKGNGINIRGRINVPGGTLKWINLKASLGSSSKNRRIYNGLILDITRRKLAEQEQLASERKVVAMSKAVEDALIMIDSQGVVRFWNPAAERLFGFTAEEAVGIDFHEMAAPADIRQKAKAGIKQFARTGKGEVFGSTIQTTAQNRLGKTFPVEVTLSSFQMDEEWFAVGTVRDITLRKKMEEETALLLAESRQRNTELEIINRVVKGMTGELDFNKILELTVNALDESFNPHTVYIAIYHATTKQINFPYYRVGDQLRYQPPESLAKGLTSTIIENRSYLLLGTLQEQIDNGAKIATGECETYLGVPIMAGRHAVGVMSLQAIEKNHYTNDHARLASTIATNLGIALENARLYQETQAAEERSRMLLNSAGEGIFGIDTSGRMTFVNPAALRMLKFSEKDLIGKDVHQLIHHSAEDGKPYDETQCPMTNSYKHGTVNQVTDEVLWCKDGTSLFAEYASTPIKKENRLVGAVVTFRDVTERRMAEAKLKTYLDELERFNRLVIGREEKMIQLKKEINELLEQLGLDKKYKIIQ